MNKLNTSMVLAAAVLSLSSVAASAQPLTRDQVKAQLAAAEASGRFQAFNGEDSGSAYLSAHFHSTEPRAKVKSELAAAKNNGTLDLLGRTDGGSAYLSAHFHSTEPRPEVKSELAAAKKNGTLNALYGEDSGSFKLSAERGSGSGTGPAVASR